MLHFSTRDTTKPVNALEENAMSVFECDCQAKCSVALGMHIGWSEIVIMIVLGCDDDCDCHLA
jgi:hypothetical protein